MDSGFSPAASPGMTKVGMRRALFFHHQRADAAGETEDARAAFTLDLLGAVTAPLETDLVVSPHHGRSAVRDELRRQVMDQFSGSREHGVGSNAAKLMHPAVAEVAVLGVPDAKWGEVGVAVVVSRDPDLSAQALLAHLEGRCAKYRWPRQVFFWDVMPKSGYGKIVKKDIKVLLVERGECQSVAL
jgi:hypothetical protein